MFGDYFCYEGQDRLEDLRSIPSARLKSSLLAEPDIGLRRCLDFRGYFAYIRTGVLLDDLEALPYSKE